MIFIFNLKMYAKQTSIVVPVPHIPIIIKDHIVVFGLISHAGPSIPKKAKKLFYIIDFCLLFYTQMLFLLFIVEF